MGDSPEDMYFEDNYIGDIKAEKIEEKEEKMSLIFNLKRKIDAENEANPKKYVILLFILKNILCTT